MTTRRRALGCRRSARASVLARSTSLATPATSPSRTNGGDRFRQHAASHDRHVRHQPPAIAREQLQDLRADGENQVRNRLRVLLGQIADDALSVAFLGKPREIEKIAERFDVDGRLLVQPLAKGLPDDQPLPVDVVLGVEDERAPHGVLRACRPLCNDRGRRTGKREQASIGTSTRAALVSHHVRPFDLRGFNLSLLGGVGQRTSLRISPRRACCGPRSGSGRRSSSG